MTIGRAASDCGSRAGARMACVESRSARGSFRSAITRFRQSWAPDKSVDDRVRAATDCGSRAAARGEAFMMPTAATTRAASSATTSADGDRKRNQDAFQSDEARGSNRSINRRPCACGDGWETGRRLPSTRLCIGLHKPCGLQLLPSADLGCTSRPKAAVALDGIRRSAAGQPDSGSEQGATAEVR